MRRVFGNRFRGNNAYLGSAAVRTKRYTFLYGGLTLVAGMFHASRN
jgi:hypothetical protein